MAVDAQHSEVVSLLLKHGAKVDSRDEVRDTPLMLAVRKGETASVRLLLEHGAKVNTQNWIGDSALHEAVRYCRPQIAADLIRAGAKVDLDNESQQSAPDLARQSNNADLLAVLAGTPSSPRCVHGRRSRTSIPRQSGKTLSQAWAALGRVSCSPSPAR